MTSRHFISRTPRGVTRRTFLTGAAAAATYAMLPSRPGAAQSIDPFTYITAMDATTDVGQKVGQPASEVDPVAAGGWYWDAYIQLPIKEGQDFHLSCEFDTAWIILMAYGFDVPLDEQLEIVGIDDSIEPWYEDNGDGTFTIYGGDINNYFCGHIDTNILAKCRCNAMRKVFEAKGLGTVMTPTREEIEAALLRGEPVFFKSTVDMLPWRPATWHTTGGEQYPVVLSNDHALAVMGFNADEVIIRDPLGPTSTNWERPWQWRVSWERFLEVIAAQGNDAMAITPAPVDPA
ncbi:MAG TPA: hypothetical protein VKZ61_08890 [Thermomicrobiales bacterium]|nr:hypothetical protein [Thermomicrobiales bacterium]